MDIYLLCFEWTHCKADTLAQTNFIEKNVFLILRYLPIELNLITDYNLYNCAHSSFQVWELWDSRIGSCRDSERCDRNRGSMEIQSKFSLLIFVVDFFKELLPAP